MENIIIIFVLLVIFFILAQKKLVKQDLLKESNYKKKGPLLNLKEGAFFNALKTAVGDNGVVMTKVSMTSVVGPEARNKKQWFVANQRIAKSYFDYVVCDPRTMEVRVVIELDNGLELNKGKVEREKLLIHVCKSAGIPLIGTSVRHSYQVSRLRRLLAAHIDLIEEDGDIRFCKKCGSPMVIRIASVGEHKGRRFFTCSRQPQCTYTENYNVVFETEDGAHEE